MRLKKEPGLDLKISGAHLPKGERNLIGKAYEALCHRLGNRPGLEVKLKKRIPVGAGLGGGSSDAASFLMGANHLMKLRLSKEVLCDLGLSVGSDLPFFLQDSVAALGEGRGERLITLPLKALYFFVIVAFKKSLSTKEIYQAWDRNRCQPVSLTKVRAGVRICADSLNKKNLKQAKMYFHNDLSKLACSKLNRIADVLAYWQSQEIPSLMSGSGSSVFAVFESKSKALRHAKGLVGKQDLKVFVAESFHESLNDRIKEELLQ